MRYITENILKLYSLLGGIDLGPHPYLQFALEIIFGNYEKEYCDLLPQFLKEGDLVLDVGANIGYFSLKFSKYIGENGYVIAFEPNPETFSILQKNTKNRKNVECLNLGLSEENDSLNLFVANNNINTASFLSEYPAEHLLEHEKSVADIKKYKVDLVNGTSFLHKRKINSINFLKIDVEGWEINVLKGLDAVIKSSPGLVIFIELNMLSQEMSGYKPDDLFKYIIGLGFQIFYLNDNLVLDQLTESNFTKLKDKLGLRGFTTLICQKNRVIDAQRSYSSYTHI
jgi:FkbM family methyltransferase